MGYNGKGLGKTENGILESITIHNSYRETGATNNNQRDKKDSIVILSDSMLMMVSVKSIMSKSCVMTVVLIDACIHM